MAAYREFLELGDQWLIAYSCATSNTPIPTLFLIGHCLESYCKAALLKHDPAITPKELGHRIEQMISGIQKRIGILQGITFHPTVEHRFMTGGLIPFSDSIMSDAEYLHYISNQERRIQE